MPALRKLQLWALAAAVAVASLAPAPRAALAQEPTEGETQAVAVLGVASYNSLIGDINYLSNLVGRPEGGQMLEGMIALFTQGKGLAGVDKDRPWGVVLQTDGAAFMPIVCLPVSDLDQVLQILQGFQISAIDMGDGVSELTSGDQVFYVKQVDDWAFLAQQPEVLDAAPADPLGTIKPIVDQYDAGIRLMAQRVPQMYKDIAVQQLQSGMEDGLQQEADESDEQFELRRQMAQAQVEQVKQVIQDVDELTVGLAIGAEAGGMYYEGTLTAVADTKLHKQLSGYEDTSSSYAGFARDDAAMRVVMSQESPEEMPEEDIEQVRGAMNTLRQQAASAIDDADEIPNDETREVLKSSVNDLIDALEATLVAGKIDVGASVDIAEDNFNIIAGALVLEPEKVESALKKLSEVAQESEEFPGVKWEADSYEGAKFHTLDIPVPADKDKAQKLVGDTLNVVIGIGDDAVFFGAGRDALATVKKAIADSKSSASETVPPLSLIVSLGQVIEAAAALDNDPEPGLVAMAEAFKKHGGEDANLEVTANVIPNGVRYRLSVQEGVLKVMGTAAQQAGGAGFGG